MRKKNIMNETRKGLKLTKVNNMNIVFVSNDRCDNKSISVYITVSITTTLSKTKQVKTVSITC